MLVWEAFFALGQTRANRLYPLYLCSSGCVMGSEGFDVKNTVEVESVQTQYQLFLIPSNTQMTPKCLCDWEKVDEVQQKPGPLTYQLCYGEQIA